MHDDITLNFGAYSGSCFEDVPADYLCWLYCEKAGDAREKVFLAILLEHLADRDDIGAYELPFGKHRGEALEDVPDGYLDWLLTEADIRAPLRMQILLHMSGGDHASRIKFVKEQLALA